MLNPHEMCQRVGALHYAMLQPRSSSPAEPLPPPLPLQAGLLLPEPPSVPKMPPRGPLKHLLRQLMLQRVQLLKFPAVS